MSGREMSIKIIFLVTLALFDKYGGEFKQVETDHV